MEEIFRVLEGFSEYLISNKGRIISVRKNRKEAVELKPYTVAGGYKMVKLTSDDGKPSQEYVHRLVGKAFVENPNGYSEINHKDENKGNNRADNLEWCTRTYNMSMAHGSKGLDKLETEKRGARA